MGRTVLSWSARRSLGCTPIGISPIGDHDIEVLIVEQRQGIGRRGLPRHDETAARHRLGQRLRHALVIVDDEDMPCHARSFTSLWQNVSWGIMDPTFALSPRNCLHWGASHAPR
jgi:hypothetical protein